MGLGKTFVGSEKAMNLEIDILLVCQKSKIDDWKMHFFEYYIDKMKCDESAWCYDLTTSSGMDMFFHSRYKIKIGIINYDLVFRRPELLKLNGFTLMLDESSNIQNEKAKRSKFVLKLQPENVILLSGTPVSGKYENLWTQAKLLGWNISEKLYQQHYVNWKTIDVGGVPVKTVNKEDPYKNIERLKNKFRENGAVFMKTEECFELPKQNFIDIKVNSSKEYRKFKRSRIVTACGEELVGDTKLVQMLCERKLCGMYSQEKLQAFKDLAESTGDRLIVFYNFNDELCSLKKVAEELERPISEVNGKVKDLKAYESESNSITFIQYQAGAMGLNLQKADKVIYFTLPLMSELFEQSKKRIHRIGQEKPCFYYTLLVKDSVELDIKEVLEMRKDFKDELFK
ncbi:MAG: ATP-dependent helicase [Peptostreptococcaceae bacterium]|nr:ATP-dependent helicase [Peptostreptococcaceae bacterium]